MRSTVATALTIPATDGVPLAATVFEPPGDRDLGRSVIVSPALGVWRTYYDAFAGYLAGRGFRVVTYDYRGSGETGLRGAAPAEVAMRHWGERDVAGVIGWTAQRRPGDRVLSVGHSAGGQVAGLAGNNDRIEGLLTVAAGSGYWGHWPGPKRWILALLWYVGMPLTSRLLGRFPGRALGLEDIPAGIALEWASWCRDPDYLAGESGPPSAVNFRRFRGRLRAYALADDRYLPPASVRALTELYASARDRECVEVDPRDVGAASIGHFGFFGERFRETLWDDAGEWLETA